MKTKLNIPILTVTELETEFTFLSQHETHGVLGVYEFDSGKEGPTLGVTINTHGNEPSGLATFLFLRKHFLLSEKLISGKVVFVLNNMKATEKYFQSLKIENSSEREESRGKSRSYDINMNRLPPDTMSNSKYSEYEIVRARELYDIWKSFDFSFDIHSASQDSPMIIACDGIDWNLIKGFPIQAIITNITNVQLNKPAVHFYGKPNSFRLAIESGSHEGVKSFERSIQCSLALMINLEMLKGTFSTEKVPSIYKHYRVMYGITVPDRSYTVTKVFKTFEDIKKNDAIAVSPCSPTIPSPITGHTLLATGNLKPENITEEIVFISEPVENIQS